MFLEKLDQFRPIRNGNSKDLDKLADLLDVIVINLKEAGRHEELGHGSLYIKIQKKMTELMLSNYNRWLFEHKKPECREKLQEWIIQEAEFQAVYVAAETLCGVVGRRREGVQTFFGQTRAPGKAESLECDHEFCRKDHPLWRCEEFKKMDVQSRWPTVKQLRVYFCCLRRNHTSDRSARSTPCGIHGCQRTQNRLLHGGLVTKNDFADDRVNHRPEIADHDLERALVTEMGRSQSGNVPGNPSKEGESSFLYEISLTITKMKGGGWS